jgi:hypothetical protein
VISPRRTVPLLVDGPPPNTGVCLDPMALSVVLVGRTTTARNRLEAIARNYPPIMRKRGLHDLADGLEDAVRDVIGVEGDPSRPGALGRMLDEVAALITNADDC